MNWGPLDLHELHVLLPIGILTFGALLQILILVLFSAKLANRIALYPTMIAIALALISYFFLDPEIKFSFGGLLIHDHLGFSFALVILLLSLIGIPAMPTGTASFREGGVGAFCLILLSISGSLLMVSANHLVVFFIGLELLSLPLYVLSGVGCNSRKSAEGAFKYFLLGAVASAFFVYGSAMLWAGLGTMSVSEMSTAIATRGITSISLSVFGAALVLTGLAFKVGLAPFHMWVPDVYQGAPGTLVGWMSGAVKAAAFCFAIRIFGQALPTTTFNWPMVLSWLAMGSMIWGSLAALYQRDMKRMLAYSSVAHAGYASITLVAGAEGVWEQSVGSLVFYVLVYGLASFVSFMVVTLEEAEGRTSVHDLSGLSKRRPALAFALALALFSLAGLPPLGGFIAKFNVFALAVKTGHIELVLIGVLTSVISLGYYLRLMVSAYMEDPMVEGKPRVNLRAGFVLTAGAALTLFLGILPGNVLDFLIHAGQSLLP